MPRLFPEISILFLLLLAGLLYTSERLPLTWDEGEYIERAEKYAAWLHSETPFAAAVIEAHLIPRRWEGHPTGFVAVLALGKKIAPPALSPKNQARFGSLLLVALALSAVYVRIRSLLDRKAAILAVLCILLIPRLFAHMHFASCDAILIAGWLLFWATSEKALAPSCLARGPQVPASNAAPGPAVHGLNGWPILCGIFLGLTLSAKFPGWLAPIPWLIWAAFHLYTHRNSPVLPTILPTLWRILVVLSIALLVFFLLNPWLWHRPFAGFLEFFHLNLHRPEYNISILFLGRMYDLYHPLPVYNTLLWTMITVPLGLLLLVAIGLWRGFSVQNAQTAKNIRAFSLLVALNALILLILRSVPGTPVHDGVRLFVVSYAFFGIFAGIGAWYLLTYAPRPQIAARWVVHAARLTVCVILVLSSWNLHWYGPQWLSYYNALIGGLDGAARAGFEPTYYWDGLDAEVLDWLHANTPEGEKIKFSAISPKTLRYQRQWGTLQRDFLLAHSPRDADAQKPFHWYVLQRRPSGESWNDIELILHAEPAYIKHIRPGGFWIWRLDRVPIIEIYSESQYRYHRVE